MTFTQSIEDDLLVIGTDDPRTVRIYRRSSDNIDPPGSGGGEQVTGVHRVDLPAPPLETAGAILPRNRWRYHLQARQLGYVSPEPADVLFDENDNVRCSIDEVHENDNKTRYVVIVTEEH